MVGSNGGGGGSINVGGSSVVVVMVVVEAIWLVRAEGSVRRRRLSHFFSLSNGNGYAMAEKYATEIAKRPPRTWSQAIHGTIFIAVFSLGCLMVNMSQLVVLFPLSCLPFSFANSIYHAGIRLSRGAFGTLLGTFFLSF